MRAEFLSGPKRFADIDLTGTSQPNGGIGGIGVGRDLGGNTQIKPEKTLRAIIPLQTGTNSPDKKANLLVTALRWIVYDF